MDNRVVEIYQLKEKIKLLESDNMNLVQLMKRKEKSYFVLLRERDKEIEQLRNDLQQVKLKQLYLDGLFDKDKVIVE